MTIPSESTTDRWAPAQHVRALMSRFPTGVAVVACTDVDGSPYGMTCSSVVSVTLSPPTLLICLRDLSPTLAAVRRSGRFTVNMLHDDGRPAAELFASGAPHRFDTVAWEHGEAGPHLSDDAHSTADCAVSECRVVGDHAVVFGEVTRVGEYRSDGAPLLYGMRGYRSWAS